MWELNKKEEDFINAFAEFKGVPFRSLASATSDGPQLSPEDRRKFSMKT
jgi:hypothetical protein